MSRVMEVGQEIVMTITKDGVVGVIGFLNDEVTLESKQ